MFVKTRCLIICIRNNFGVKIKQNMPVLVKVMRIYVLANMTFKPFTMYYEGFCRILLSSKSCQCIFNTDFLSLQKGVYLSIFCLLGDLDLINNLISFTQRYFMKSKIDQLVLEIFY